MGENEVLKAMETVRFDTMGVNRSYLDFYLGFGWSLSVAMLLQSVLLWQLASLARSNAAEVRPMVPALFSGALLIVLVAAYMRA
jgi:ABC-type polysaccharide/polyol phosphate export permease